eukprot:15239_1
MAESTNDADNKKRSFVEMDTTDGEPLLPDTKKHKTDENDQEITQEDMAFLFQLKQQQNGLSSLHEMNRSVNVTTDINHTSYFAAPSIASTNNSTTMDALSTTATTHTNPPANFDLMTDNQNNHKDKAAEKYYRQIVHRSSRVGQSYQASFLPKVQTQDADDAKYGGSASTADSPTTIGEKLRDERNEKRNNLDQTCTNDEENEEKHNNNNIGAMMAFNNMNFDEEEEDDEDDEDFNMDAYENDNAAIRVMEGIIGRRCDWLAGDDGKPFDDNTRIQYLVKWKDSAQPVWEYADELEQYQMKVDHFEDDDMEEDAFREMNPIRTEEQKSEQVIQMKPIPTEDTAKDGQIEQE